MSEILLYYRRPDPTTWVYLSSFLTIGLFFVFHRVWSIRNLDIVLLILLAPGLLMVYEGRRRQLAESEMIQTEMTQMEAAEGESTLEEFNREGAQINPANSSDAEPGSRQPDVGFNSSSLEFRERAESERIENSIELQAGEVAQTSFLEMTKAVGGSFVGFVSQAIEGSSEVGSENTDNSSAQDVNQAGKQRDGENQTSTEPETQSNGNSNLDSVGDLNAPLLDSSSSPDPAESINVISGESESFLTRTLRGPEDPRQLQRWGFVYLFTIELVLLLRLMLDPLMVRRPLLDPNLTTGGLYFIGISLFIFMMANVVTSSPRVQVQQGPELGPGYAMMNLLPAIPTRPVSDQPGGVIPPRVSELTPNQVQLAKIAKTLAILAQFFIVVGIVLVGSRHFFNVRAGVGCSLLYLLLPYTAQMTGRVDHALPAALILWAVLCYRRPLLSGAFLGLAGGLVYYPLFVLPLWVSFYWKRGARKFCIGVASMLILLMVALSFDSSASLSDHLYRMFGLLKPDRDPQEFRGLWALGWNPIWRLPVIVGFAILATFFAIWPARKNLGTLMSSSAALMVAAQFWHGYGGGLYIAWFMPLLLLVVFRPNLQDRIAAKVVVGTHPPILLGETETEPA